MKRILSVVLAVCLVFALSVSALADSQNITSVTENNTATINVGVTVTPGGTAEDTIVHNYYVVVDWTVTNPKYTTAQTAGTVYTWDGAQQKYTTAAGTNGTSGSGSDGTATVTVTNKSDMDIKASAAYAANGSNGTTWAGTAADQSIAKVPGTGDLTTVKNNTDYSTATALKHEFSGAISLGSYAPSTDGETLGTITVTISAATGA